MKTNNLAHTLCCLFLFWAMTVNVFYLEASSSTNWNRRQKETQQSQGTSRYGFRDYNAPLTDQEKRDIRFIIITLATKSQLSLLFEKNALHNAGERVDHVHPLKFLSYVFTDNELRHAVKKINGLPWRRFVQGMEESLADSAKIGNMKQEYIADFANTVGIPETLVAPSVQRGKWGEFVNAVRNSTT